MRLILIRHGDADHAENDWQRALSETGVAQAELAGRTLRDLGMTPGLVCTSELSRAKQTGEEIKKYYPDVELISSEYLSPESDQRQIVQLLQSWNHQTVLLIGHEPHLSGLISLLVTGSRTGRFALSRCGMAVIHFEGAVSYGSGVLKTLIQSGDLRLIRKG